MALLETRRFGYRYPRTQLLGMTMVAIALPLALAYIAFTNHKGLRLFGFFSFTPRGASLLYWVLAAATLLAAAVVLWIVARAISGEAYVELGPLAATLPEASLAMTLVSIPYDAVSGIRCTGAAGQQWAIVTSPVGEARLSALAFDSPDDFSDFLRLLQARVAAGTPGAASA